MHVLEYKRVRVGGEGEDHSFINYSLKHTLEHLLSLHVIHKGYVSFSSYNNTCTANSIAITKHKLGIVE